MIANAMDVQDLIAALLYGLICFGSGVAWSAYRAVGWVDRMHAWAATVVRASGSDQEPPNCLATREVDPKGVN